MQTLSVLLFFLLAFGLVALASRQIGEFFSRYRLPLISGFLFTGILAGPFMLNLIPAEEVTALQFINEMALAFIAFAAGGELNLAFVRGNLRPILALIAGQTLAVLALGAGAFVLLAEAIPFMRSLTPAEVWAVGLLGATIMVARSPSSALAIIKELRAKGPFTQKVLGATVLKDALVILIFTISVSLAAALIEGGGFRFSLLGFVALEIAFDILAGIGVGFILRGIMSLRHKWIKYVLLLLSGYLVFYASQQLQGIPLGGVPFTFFSEPLLICMVSGFYVANFTRYGAEFHKTIEEMSGIVFLAFFTLVGAELELDVLRSSWLVAFVLLLVRLGGIFTGSFLGGVLSGDSPRQSAILGMTFITQAGVSIGLAKEIGVEFQPWGSELATLSIAVIIINQVIGPPMFKWAIQLVGEAHLRAKTPAFDGVRDAFIFGLESQSLALTRQLKAHDWEAVIVTRAPERLNRLDNVHVPVIAVPDHSLETLEKINLKKADTVVLMLTDEENFRLCERIYEHFGTKHVIVRLHDRANAEKFTALGALIFDPNAAMISLLDHFVRSPGAISLLLGTEDGQDVADLVVRNPQYNGIALRDLYLPSDTLVLSIHRDGQTIISHGYTRLKVGDEVTVLGSPESLAELSLLFEN